MNREWEIEEEIQRKEWGSKVCQIWIDSNMLLYIIRSNISANLLEMLCNNRVTSFG